MTPKVFQRTYEKLKQEVTSGRYKPGQRLQARALADVLKASTSPVTNAMRQLVGEAILEYTAEDGFIIPWVNEQRLRDLLTWSRWLTTDIPAGIELAQDASAPHSIYLPVADIGLATEQFMAMMVVPLQNLELSRNITNANERLRSIRHLEGTLVLDRAEELTAMVACWTDGDQTALRAALQHYFQRRTDLVPQLVGLSYQDRH